MTKESSEKAMEQMKARGPAHQETSVPKSARETMYCQHFIPQVSRVKPPAGFIEQVNGYGVQVFSQASSFTAV